MMDRLQQERQENVAGYMVRMWHLEDVLRATKFDPASIRATLVDPMDGDAEQKANAYGWYLALAERMVKEGLTRHGHLSEVLEALTDLEALHHALINVMEEPLYASLYTDAKEDIEALGRQVDNEEDDRGIVELCFTGLYGVMLLRAQGREISKDTAAADERIRKLLENLSVHYRQMRKLPGISLN